MQPNSELKELPISAIRPNPDQPRQTFEEEPLRELAASLQAYGQLQPISVMPNGDGYIIIAGERRWRAAQIAGWSTITALVRENLTEQEAYELSLMENVMRQAVNPVEEARAYKRLMEEMGMAEEDVCKRYGWGPGAVAWKVQVLEARDEVLHLVAHGGLTMNQAWYLARISANGQARALRALGTEEMSNKEFTLLCTTIHEQENAIEMFAPEDVEQDALARKAGKVARDFIRLASAAAQQIGDYDERALAEGLTIEVGAEEKVALILKALNRVKNALGRKRAGLLLHQDTLDKAIAAGHDDGNGTSS